MTHFEEKELNSIHDRASEYCSIVNNQSWKNAYINLMMATDALAELQKRSIDSEG